MNELKVWLKTHWLYVAGGIVGFFLLYYIYKSYVSSSSSSAASSNATDLSGGANQVLALSSAASLQNAQINGAIESTQLQANVANNQTAAALQATEVTTAAQLAATQGTTAANEAVALGAQQTQLGIVQAQVGGAENIQQTLSNQAIKQTQIQGSTYEGIANTESATELGLAHIQAGVELSQLSDVNKQVANLATYSKHFGTDIQSLAPTLALELGASSAAPGLEAGKAAGNVAASNTATAGVLAGGSLLSSISKGLFGTGA